MASDARKVTLRALLAVEPAVCCLAIWVMAVVFVRLLDGSMDAVIVLLWAFLSHLTLGAVCVVIQRRLPKHASGWAGVLADRVARAGGNPAPEMPIVVGRMEEQRNSPDADSPQCCFSRGFQESFMENPGGRSRLGVSASLAGAFLVVQCAVWFRVGGYSAWSIGTRAAVAVATLALAVAAVIAVRGLVSPPSRARYPTAWRFERHEPRLLTPALWMPAGICVVFSQLALHAPSLRDSAARLVVFAVVSGGTLTTVPALASSPAVDAVERWITAGRPWRVYRASLVAAWLATRAARATTLTLGVIATSVGVASLSLPMVDPVVGAACIQLGLVLAGGAAMLDVTRTWPRPQSPDLLRARTISRALDGTSLGRRAQIATFVVLSITVVAAAVLK